MQRKIVYALLMEAVFVVSLSACSYRQTEEDLNWAAKVIEEATEPFRAVRDGDTQAVMEEGADTVQAVANLLDMYGIHTFQVEMNRCYMKHLKRNCRKDV